MSEKKNSMLIGTDEFDREQLLNEIFTDCEELRQLFEHLTADIKSADIPAQESDELKSIRAKIASGAKETVSPFAIMAAFFASIGLVQDIDDLYDKAFRASDKSKSSQTKNNNLKITLGEVFAIILLMHIVGSGAIYKGNTEVDASAIAIITNFRSTALNITFKDSATRLKKFVAEFGVTRFCSFVLSRLYETTDSLVPIGPSNTANVDSTSLTVFTKPKESEVLSIVHGYCRDKDPSAPQVSIYIVCIGTKIVYVGINDGNTADSTEFCNIIEMQAEALKQAGVKYFCCDAAGCNNKVMNAAIKHGLTLITRARAPMQVTNECIDKLNELSPDNWQKLNIEKDPHTNHRAAVVHGLSHGDIPVTCYAFTSNEQYNQAHESVQRSAEAHLKQAKKALNKLFREGRACEADLDSELEKIKANYPLLSYVSGGKHVLVRKEYNPAKDSVFVLNEKAIATKAQNDSYFILRSCNEKEELAPEQVLMKYNGNQIVEHYWKITKSCDRGSHAVLDSSCENILATVAFRVLASAIIRRFEEILRSNMTVEQKKTIANYCPELKANPSNEISAHAYFSVVERVRPDLFNPFGQKTLIKDVMGILKEFIKPLLSPKLWFSIRVIQLFGCVIDEGMSKANETAGSSKVKANLQTS